MATAFIYHEVEDFDRWKRAFDDHEQTRIKYGVTSHRLYRDEHDHRHITVALEAEDASRVRAFLTSDELKKTMADAGVKGTPSTWISQAFEDVTYPLPTRSGSVIDQAETVL